MLKTTFHASEIAVGCPECHVPSTIMIHQALGTMRRAPRRMARRVTAPRAAELGVGSVAMFGRRGFAGGRRVSSRLRVPGACAIMRTSAPFRRRDMRATLAAVLLCAGAQAAPVSVSLAGRPVEVAARTEGQAIVGQILPLIRALGGAADLLVDQGRLSGRTFDGKPFQAEVGGSTITVGDRGQGLGAPLRIEGGELVGPLVDVATALGARASYVKAQSELRIAPRLAQVEVHSAEEGAVIHVLATGPSTPTLEHIAEPPRAYADFPGLTWVGGSESIRTGGAGGVYGIRWALFQEWPPIARVVLDLVPGTRARLLPAEDGLFVLTTRVPQTAAPIEPPVPAPAGAGSLEGLHILLDPAAGGDDAGVTGAGTTEKAVALDIALRAAIVLMNAKALVSLSRDADRSVS
ncbi:MAG: hypothetical protein FJX75_23600, partial [Armatimonadetes bacterium]|nr:hypothetical protein [Armatimonadota bacterium]